MTLCEGKALLRQKHKQARLAMTAEEKQHKDERIFEQMCKILDNTAENTVFTYVSGDIEVDTRRIIHYSLMVGKRVAVPRCLDGNGTMRFYYIDSPEQLIKGRFGILEPRADCAEVRDLSQGLCIVPGLSFDGRGRRLGFGKGYYDRFLAEFGGTAVGLCYACGFTKALPTDNFDRPVEILVTEAGVYRFNLCS